ncbi:hypothetical protein BH09PSE5_BH09PSE5_46110 [soil metagenome]
MIHSIESSLPSFKSVRFHEGLNVLLSDKNHTSTDKMTRNSAGKTSLVEIVHFLLGADCERDSLLRDPALIEHTFRGRFRIGGELVTVERGGADPSKVFLLAGSEYLQDFPKKLDKVSERFYLSNLNWRRFLGHSMFGLPLEKSGTAFDEPYTPSFRSMFSYFARRRDSGGFIAPERQAEKQHRSDWQVNLSYLLGLDWQIPFEFSKIRLREKTLEELRKAVKEGALGQVVGTVAELRPQVTIAGLKAEKLGRDLAAFEVHDSYKELSRRAAQARTEMQAIARHNISLEENLEHLEAALRSEKPPQRSDIQQLYAAAGIELPGVALRRFDEVGAFYESVVLNRRLHLENEIASIKTQLAEQEANSARLDQERSSILKSLEGRGALDDFLDLQRDFAEAEARAAALRERFKAAEVLEGETTKLDIDRANLQRRLQDDHRLRADALTQAIVHIANAISRLYDDRTGRFVVEATDNGPEFRISIEGDRGGGISNVEIFCFDLSLFKVVTARGCGPGFLLHDSHLFDGVDERQIASALQLGLEATVAKGLQYIVTMNSDIFERLPMPAGFDTSKVVLQTRLSDAGEGGGLFGFRFG